MADHTERRNTQPQMIGGQLVDVDWSERRASGGMFDATVGVFHDDDGRYFAFVKDWGGGAKSPPHPSLDAARGDVDRLWRKMFGGEA